MATALVIVGGLTACAAPTPAPTATVPPSPTSTSRPTFTPTPSTTPSPTSSPTPTYALTPAAVMRLEDAEREVLSWLDPVRSPRVERAFYVTEGEVWAAEVDGDTCCWLAPEQMDIGRAVLSKDSPRLLVLIQASTAGTDIMHQAGEHAGQAPSSSNIDRRWPDICEPVPSGRRQGVVAIFDATDGGRIGAGAVTKEMSQVLATLATHGRRALPASTPLAVPTNSATATLSPTVNSDASPLANTPPPDRWDPDFEPRPLGIGEVPAALVDAVHEYPLVNGSTWTYRRSSHRDGVQWWHDTYTVTIDAAWQVAPDAMLVRTGPGSCGRIVLPDGVFAECEFMSLAAMRDSLATPLPPPDSPMWGQPAWHRPELARIPFRVWTTAYVGYVGVPSHEDVLTLPAGRFRGCFETRTVQNAGNSMAEWTCRGVGLVRRDNPLCSSMYGGHDADELMHYWIPPIKPVEASR